MTQRNFVIAAAALSALALGTPGPARACQKHAGMMMAQNTHSGHSGHQGHGGHAGHEGHSANGGQMDHSMHSMEAGEALKDKSIYHASGKWTDSAGKPLVLEDLKGKPVVVAMAYTRCKYICPRITADMKTIQSKLPEKLRKDVRFVLLSLDSDHDRPEKLKEYAAKHKLDPATWTLLHGDADSVQEAAALLGVKYKRESNGVDFAHSYIVTLLDNDGVIKAQRIGAGEPKEKILAPLLKGI